MQKHFPVALAFSMITVGMSLTASGQGRPDPATLIAAQREAMTPLDRLKTYAPDVELSRARWIARTLVDVRNAEHDHRCVRLAYLPR